MIAAQKIGYMAGLKIGKKFLGSLLTLFLVFSLVISPNVYAFQVVVSGNGEGSTNEVQADAVTEIVVEQVNEAEISNDVEVAANTGGNDISQTTGGDVQVDTGNAKVLLEVENSINSSSVDIGCCGEGTSVEISNNGSDSTNQLDLNLESNTTGVIKQSAKITNEIQGSVNTGRNTVGVSSGNLTIKTGDIKVSGSVVNGPVNVSTINGASGGGDMSLQVSGNGSGSQNNINVSSVNQSFLYVTNLSTIYNNVDWDLNTGENEVEKSGGDIKIITGDIFFDFFIKNGPINIGGITWDCCNLDDHDDPGDHGSPSDPNDPSDPDDPSVGGSGNSENGNSGNSGVGSSSGSSSSGTGGTILGLSDTSSEQAQLIIFLAGLLMMTVGIKLIGSELLTYNLRNR